MSNGIQPQNTAVQKQPSAVAALQAVCDATSVQAQFKNALGEHKDAFIASLIELYTGDKSLQSCKPAAVVAEALRAATLRLPLNKALGFAYIVVYNNNIKSVDPATGRDVWTKVPTPTFMPGYKGLIQLAKRSQLYETINADVVYEGELVKADKLSGDIDLSGEKKSDKIIGYFAYIKELNGFHKVYYMTVEEMAKYAIKFSPSMPKNMTVEKLVEIAQKDTVTKGVGWVANFTAMARKTVLRRLISVYGSQSVEMQSVISKDMEIDHATADRNDAIAEGANAEVLDVSSVEYEEVNVDTDTGEVLEQKLEQPNVQVDEDPGY